MPEEKTYTRKELETELNEAQKKCCNEYVLTWQKAKSYMKAYPDSSYEAAAVSMNAFLKNPKILQYIEFVKQDIENVTGVSKIRNIQELSKIAYSDISRYHDTWIELADWEGIKNQYPEAMAAVESIETKTEYRTIKGEFDQETDYEVKYIKFKLYPKIQAIQTINKMMGYDAPDKLDLTSKGEKLSIEWGGKKIDI